MIKKMQQQHKDKKPVVHQSSAAIMKKTDGYSRIMTISISTLLTSTRLVIKCLHVIVISSRVKRARQHHQEIQIEANDLFGN